MATLLPEEHRVTVRSGGVVIENWNSYDVTCDMLNAADQFRLSLGPADAVGDEFGEVWAAVAPDADVQILLDDVVIVSGFIDERTGTSSVGGDTITVSGRDRCGRLLDETMPLIGFRGLSIEDLALKICAPWLSKISFSNAENRAVVIGRGRGAKGGRVYKEPHTIGKRKPRSYRKVEPGETRWGVLSYFMHENDFLAWGAADGKSLIIGEPNYDQEPTFSFFHAAAGSTREALGNCASFTVHDSVAERYSEIIALGSNAGTARDYAEKVVHRKGVARNGPKPDGTGKDFRFRKVLLLSDDDIRNDAQANTRAAREMAERDASGHEITITAYGHGQQLPGARAPSLFACDTMAFVESEVFGIRGAYLITSVQFRRSREECTTEIRLVPKGTLLRL